MTFEEAKKKQAELEADFKKHGDVLRTFPRNAIGLVYDEIRQSKEYQTARQNADRAFARLRDYNAVFIPKYAKELREERRNRVKFI